MRSFGGKDKDKEKDKDDKENENDRLDPGSAGSPPARGSRAALMDNSWQASNRLDANCSISGVLSQRLGRDSGRPPKSGE
jgi:hypothetical protein